MQTATFLLFSDSGTVLDSIGVFPVIEGHARIIEGGQSMYYWPFHAEGFVGASGGLVVHVWGRSPEVRLLGLDGRIGRIVRLGDRPVEFTGELRDAEGDRIARTRPEASRPAFERDWAALEFPDSLPLFSAMLVDRGGDIWLQEHALGTPAERRWIVVRPDGALLAEVMLPAGLRVLEIGPDYILGIQRDELDVESVVLLGLRRLE